MIDGPSDASGHVWLTVAAGGGPLAGVGAEVGVVPGDEPQAVTMDAVANTVSASDPRNERLGCKAGRLGIPGGGKGYSMVAGFGSFRRAPLVSLLSALVAASSRIPVRAMQPRD